MAIQVHELDSYLFEGMLCEQVTLDTRQGFVRVVIRLFYQAKLLTLRLVQARLYAEIKEEIGSMKFLSKILLLLV